MIYLETGIKAPGIGRVNIIFILHLLFGRPMAYLLLRHVFVGTIYNPNLMVFVQFFDRAVR